MLERGSIRIGTLHEFRRVEEHGSEIGDREEGIVTACSADPIVDLQRPETVSPVVRQVLGIPADAVPPPFVFQDIEFRGRADSPDCWIYCTSRSFDEAAMKRMNRDACVIINRPEEFFRALTTKLRTLGLVTGFSLGPCIYTDRVQHYTTLPATHPALIKDHSHAYQNEARAIWFPRSLPIEHIDISCPEATLLCTLYER
jgi:hypothetical protein